MRKLKHASVGVVLTGCALFGLTSAVPPEAQARPAFLNTFNTLYGTDGTAIDRCGMCHVDFGGGGPRNSYGLDFAAQGTFDAAALQAIETLNSDGDGVDNITEINAGFFPGWDCTNYLDSMGIMLDELAQLVDPNDIGCASNPPPAGNEQHG
ncbi:MAG: hypothetical protein R3308_07315 [Thiohalobacterales bacterium]|nr:hypothetical protein [Thiohalobacterales bacterium]